LRFFKIVLINSIVILFFAAVFELFFIVNQKMGFISSKTHHFQYTQILTPDEVEKKYKINIQKIPDRFKTTFRYQFDLSKIKNSDVDGGLKGRQMLSLAQKGGTGIVDLQLLPPNEKVKIYSAEFTFDEYLRRKVAFQERKISAQKFILAIGDSHTLGEGVSTGLDYPSQLASKVSNNWMIYNFGMSGEGPNDTLFRLENKNYLNGVKEKEGIAIWHFSGFHLDRLLCTLQCYKYYFENQKLRPYYKLNGETLEYKGSFQESADNNFELDRFFMRIFSKSVALDFLGISDIMNYSDQQILTAAKTFLGIKNKIRQRLNLKELYIVINSSFLNKDRVVQIFQNQGLKILDYSEIPFNSIPDSTFPVDGHPTSNEYWVLTELLKAEIDNLEKKSE
jgi:hypothetical protein